MGVPLPLNRARVALKPVRHKHLVLLVLVTVGQDVGALDRLIKVAKDVVDDEDSLGSIRRTSNIYMWMWHTHTPQRQLSSYPLFF